jgi:hypothetical protein
MNNQLTKHVFISYVKENTEQVERLYHDLTKKGVKIWLDRSEIDPGTRWKIAIQKAIRQGDFFIASFSKEYVTRTSHDKTYMNEELQLAIDELRKYLPDRSWFIPVLLSECEVPAISISARETLLDIQWVPLFQNWGDGIRRILDVIKPIPKDIQALIYALTSSDKEIRIRAVKGLSMVYDSRIISALTEALKDEDRDVRRNAAKALGEIGDAAVPALTEALKDEDRFVRWSVVEALGGIGGNVVPTLIEALKDEDRDVRRNAAEALGEIGDADAVPALTEALKDENPRVRWKVVEALGEIGDAGAVPALIGASKDEDRLVRWKVVEALGEIGDAAVPPLTEALKDESRLVRKSAVEALYRIRNA